MADTTSPRKPQVLVGALVLLTGLGLAGGALKIPGEAGYGGVGPNFLPWVVAGRFVFSAPGGPGGYCWRAAVRPSRP